MDEERFTQNRPMQTGDDLTCPNCGSHRVRWMPYPKLEFGIWFVLWLTFSLAGYAVSPIILLVGLAFWTIALIIRIQQNRRAKHYNRMHCDVCGIDFDVAKSEIGKGEAVHEHEAAYYHIWPDRGTKCSCGAEPSCGEL